MSSQQLAEELHKPIIIKFEQRKVHSSFIENIQIAELANTQLISKFNKGIRFLLCVIDFFSKYVWVVPLKNNKDITVTNAFQKGLDELCRKLNKVWVDKGSECYNNQFRSQHYYFKYRRFFPQLVQVEFWTFARAG